MVASAVELSGTPPDQSLVSDQSPLAETFQVEFVIASPPRAARGSISWRARKQDAVVCEERTSPAAAAPNEIDRPFDWRGGKPSEIAGCRQFQLVSDLRRARWTVPAARQRNRARAQKQIYVNRSPVGSLVGR